MKRIIATAVAVAVTFAPMGVSESTPSAAGPSLSQLGAGVAVIPSATAASPSASPVPEVPYDCKRWPPRVRRWKRYGYSICMHGPGWQRVRLRCRLPGGSVFIVFAFGAYVRSHQVNPDNDLSIQWCPPGYFVRRVKIERLPDLIGV